MVSEERVMALHPCHIAVGKSSHLWEASHASNVESLSDLHHHVMKAK